MDNFELLKLVKRDPVLSKIFIGIYASDNLPKHIYTRPCALIVNTQDSSGPGEHWIAMYFDVQGNVDYFDSFGFLPFIESFKTFILKNSKNQKYNRRQIQSNDSSVCGLYCLFFLYFRCRSVKMHKILNVFEWHNYKYNDTIVCRFFARVFHHVHKVCCKIK